MLAGAVGAALLSACATPKSPAPPPVVAEPVAPPAAAVPEAAAAPEVPPAPAAPPVPPAPAAVPAPRESVFVLLPEPSGASGQLTVTNRGGTQVLDQPRQATRVTGADQAPSAPVPMAEAEAQRLFGAALAAQPSEPARFVLYFRLNSDELLPESLARLSQVLHSIRERRSRDVGIVGHADAVGTREYNYRLGGRRAKRVVELLASGGADRAILAVDSHGPDDPLARTPPGVHEPRNRRVEITVR